MGRTFVSVVVLTTALVTTLVPPSHAQSNQKPLTFEVVSIVPRKDFAQGGSIKFLSGGRFQATNVYVIALIATAFRNGPPLLFAQIEGGPDWIRFDRFDVVAKTESVAGDEAALYRRLPELLRPVLEERFRLKTHWETRELPIYALVLSHQDGRLGPDMRLSNCSPRPETFRATAATVVHDERPVCEASSGGRGVIDGHGLSMLTLVSALSGLDRVVVDRTGLRGFYDLKLRWSPDAVNGAADAPSLFTALQEQLGLKLEPTKGVVDVLVIDHVERPTPD